MADETTGTTDTYEDGRHESPRERERERGREREEIVIRLPRLSSIFRDILPRETQQHLRNAQKEQLLAVRSLVDAAVRCIDDDERRERERKPSRIEIPLE